MEVWPFNWSMLAYRSEIEASFFHMELFHLCIAFLPAAVSEGPTSALESSDGDELLSVVFLLHQQGDVVAMDYIWLPIPFFSMGYIPRCMCTTPDAILGHLCPDSSHPFPPPLCPHPSCNVIFLPYLTVVASSLMDLPAIYFICHLRRQQTAFRTLCGFLEVVHCSAAFVTYYKKRKIKKKSHSLGR